MAIMFGDGTLETENTIKRTVPAAMVSDGKFTLLGEDYVLADMTKVEYYDAEGKKTDSTDSTNFAFATFDQSIEGSTIEVSANSFPGTLTDRAPVWGIKILTNQFSELLEAA